MQSPVEGADGTIYVPTLALYSSAQLLAFLPDGTIKWKFNGDYKLLNEYFSGPSVAADGTIYMGAYADESCGDCVYALFPNGTLRWQRSIAYMNSESAPVIGLDSSIYVIMYQFGNDTGVGALLALSPIDGHTLWHCLYSWSTWPVYSPTVGSDGTIYMAYDSSVAAVSPKGVTLWTYTAAGFTGAVTAGPDDTLYFGSADGLLHALTRDGSPRWKSLIWPFAYGSPAIGADGTIYVLCYPSATNTSRLNVAALNPDGARKWLFHSDVPGRDGGLAITSDGNIVASVGTAIYGVHANGTQAWKQMVYSDTFEPSAGMPAVGRDGTVYVGSQWTLYAFAAQCQRGSSGSPSQPPATPNSAVAASCAACLQVVVLLLTCFLLRNHL
jgi:hypothetical protein